VDSYFVRHESCPRCSSKDNLGVWSDGHKFCFGCRYYLAPPDSVENLKNKMEHQYNKNNDANSLDTSTFSPSVPTEALTWLKKYGISEAEYKHYGICWNTKTNSLVFPIYHDNKLIYYQERYFGPDKDKPKYVTHGSKTQKLGYIKNANFPKTIILVEDFVSAIKVGRYCTCAPLLGATIDGNAVKWLADNFTRVRIWLDMDKAAESLRQASRVPIKDIRVILSQFDPKDYTTQEIVKFLEGYGLKL